MGTFGSRECSTRAVTRLRRGPSDRQRGPDRSGVTAHNLHDLAGTARRPDQFAASESTAPVTYTRLSNPSAVRWPSG
jgi:hypothetical protein